MQMKISDEFISNRDWFSNVLAGENVILRGVSALEYLELFTGYMKESRIDVYAQNIGKYSNIRYHVVDSFSGIDYFRLGGILCSGFSQAVNDILSEDGDMYALTEAMSNYYYAHDMSFDGIIVKPENMERFAELKEWAVEFYRGG